jgi:uncharacterized protein
VPERKEGTQETTVPIEPIGDPEAVPPPERSLIRIPTRQNRRLKEVIARVNTDEELYTLWQVANINAVKRQGMSDHGPVHVQIVANIALKLLRTLMDRGVQPGVVSDYQLSGEDAEVVVTLGGLLHDIGMSIQRVDHEQLSLLVARPKIKELLDGIYDLPQKTILTSEILHAIISHRAGGRPITLEGGIVRVSDALDMAQGRSRIPFEAGMVNIHSVSAAAIEQVTIGKGETKPVRIAVRMNNSAGIFQIDELLKHKLAGSGLESYVEVEARIEEEVEKPLVRILRIG